MPAAERQGIPISVATLCHIKRLSNHELALNIYSRVYAVLAHALQTCRECNKQKVGLREW